MWLVFALPLIDALLDYAEPRVFKPWIVDGLIDMERLPAKYRALRRMWCLTGFGILSAALVLSLTDVVHLVATIVCWYVKLTLQFPRLPTQNVERGR